MSEYQLIQKKRTSKSLQELSESSERLEFGEPLYVNDTTNNVAYEISGEDPSFTIPNNKMMKYHDKNIVDKGVFYKTPSRFSTYGGTGVQLTDDQGVNITPDIPAANVFYKKPTLTKDIKLVTRQLNLGLDIFQRQNQGNPQRVTFTADAATNSITFSDGSSPLTPELEIDVIMTGVDSYPYGWIPLADLGLETGQVISIRGCPAQTGTFRYALKAAIATSAIGQNPRYVEDYGVSPYYSRLTIPEGYTHIRVYIDIFQSPDIVHLDNVTFYPVLMRIVEESTTVDVQNALDNIYGGGGVSKADYSDIAGVADKVNLLAAPEPEDYTDIKLVSAQMESTGGYLPQYPTSGLTFTSDATSNTATFSGTGPVAEAGGLPGAWVFLTGTIAASEQTTSSGWLDIDDTQIKRNHTYHLSGCPASGSEQSYYLCMQLKEEASSGSYLTYIDEGDGVDITVPDNYSFFRVFIFVTAQREERVIDLTGVVFNPVITPITLFNNYFLLGALENNGEQQLYALPARYTNRGMVTDAMWNDYAEGRNCPYSIEPGMCMVEAGDGKVRPSEDYLETPAGIVSNTHGMFIGSSVPNAKPIAVAGRVLAFVEDKKCLKIGDALKTAPNGKVAKMTRREMRKHPDKIVGYVSEFPTYENYNDVPVNGRIWVRVK